MEVQREEALSLKDELKAEELDREPKLKLCPAANAIESREQFAAEDESREYEPQTQRGARVHAARQARATLAEIPERLEQARDARARGTVGRQRPCQRRVGGVARISGRQAKELDQDEIRQRLARIAGRDLGVDQSAHEARGDAICGRLREVLGRDNPNPRQEQQRKLAKDRGRQRQLGNRKDSANAIGILDWNCEDGFETSHQIMSFGQSVSAKQTVFNLP